MCRSAYDTRSWISRTGIAGDTALCAVFPGCNRTVMVGETPANGRCRASSRTNSVRGRRCSSGDTQRRDCRSGCRFRRRRCILVCGGLTPLSFLHQLWRFKRRRLQERSGKAEPKRRQAAALQRAVPADGPREGQSRQFGPFAMPPERSRMKCLPIAGRAVYNVRGATSEKAHER